MEVSKNGSMKARQKAKEEERSGHMPSFTGSLVLSVWVDLDLREFLGLRNP